MQRYTVARYLIIEYLKKEKISQSHSLWYGMMVYSYANKPQNHPSHLIGRKFSGFPTIKAV